MNTVTLPIDGMTCVGCARSVSRALSAVPGVLAVDVSLQTARAVVRFDAAQADARRLELAVEEAGYEIRR